MGTHFAAQVATGNALRKPALSQELARPGAAALQRHAPGTILFAEGDDAEGIYEVVSGTLRLYKVLIDGRRQIIGFVSGGRLLGIAPQRQYLCSAEAVTPLIVRRYQRPAFERRIDEEPGLARRILAELSSELCLAQDQMLLLGRKSASEKVASFLVSLSADEEGDLRDHIDLPMSRGDIADYLGLTVETVSRTFTKLRNDGLIALPSPHSVEILDAEQLEELSTGAGEDDGWGRKGSAWRPAHTAS